MSIHSTSAQHGPRINNHSSRALEHCFSLFISRHFEVADKGSEKEASKIFSVPDFVGDACKAIASRIRGAVAGVQFDDFHKV